MRLLYVNKWHTLSFNNKDRLKLSEFSIRVFGCANNQIIILLPAILPGAKGVKDQIGTSKCLGTRFRIACEYICIYSRGFVYVGLRFLKSQTPVIQLKNTTGSADPASQLVVINVLIGMEGQISI